MYSASSWSYGSGRINDNPHVPVLINPPVLSTIRKGRFSGTPFDGYFVARHGQMERIMELTRKANPQDNKTTRGLDMHANTRTMYSASTWADLWNVFPNVPVTEEMSGGGCTTASAVTM
jgi:hypothetical protein